MGWEDRCGGGEERHDCPASQLVSQPNPTPQCKDMDGVAVGALCTTPQ